MRTTPLLPITPLLLGLLFLYLHTAAASFSGLPDVFKDAKYVTAAYCANDVAECCESPDQTNLGQPPSRECGDKHFSAVFGLAFYATWFPLNKAWMTALRDPHEMMKCCMTGTDGKLPAKKQKHGCARDMLEFVAPARKVGVTRRRMVTIRTGREVEVVNCNHPKAKAQMSREAAAAG